MWLWRIVGHWSKTTLSIYLLCIYLSFFRLASYFRFKHGWPVTLGHFSMAHWSAFINSVLCYLEQYICMIATGLSLCLCPISTQPAISHSSFFCLWMLLYGKNLIIHILEAGMLHRILSLCKYNKEIYIYKEKISGDTRHFLNGSH